MTTPEQHRISILVPIYNEGKTLAEVIRRVGAVEVYGLEKEVILVDDASQDSTRTVIRAIAAAPPAGITLSLIHI